MKGTSIAHFSVMNVGTHKISLTENDIDEFCNKLNSFDFSFMFFMKYCKSYIMNLNRFNPIAENKNFELAVLQKAIEIKSINPTKPFSVLWFHIILSI